MGSLAGELKGNGLGQPGVEWRVVVVVDLGGALGVMDLLSQVSSICQLWRPFAHLTPLGKQALVGQYPEGSLWLIHVVIYLQLSRSC